MNTQSIKIAESLKSRFPDTTTFRRKELDATSALLGFGPNGASELIRDFKVSRGTYDLSSLIKPDAPKQPVTTVAPATIVKMAAQVSSSVQGDTFVPDIDPTYVKWGFYDDIASVIESKSFYPVFISGLSGNGKTMMVEQACAQAEREYIRVQISPETDEDDLIGGFRLLNGETVFAKGPVIKAMERGAILLIDEIDRATNKIMCLQGVLEGKPVLIKKTGEVIRPAPGFNVIATANTKGKGSEDGRFVAATIIDEAFLERFICTLEQPYPARGVETRIISRHMQKFGNVDGDFADKLVLWAEAIRKTFLEGGVDEVISTRRLCHITQTFALFRDRLKAVELCTSRFDTDTKSAFVDLYTKIDPSVQPKTQEVPSINAETQPVPAS